MVAIIPGMGQVKEEFDALLVYAIGRRRILEIGTAEGGTLYRFLQVAHPFAEVVSIDMPGGKFGSGKPQPEIELMQSWKQPGQTLYVIRADSHDASTVNAVMNVLCGRKFDFAFIDGDHTYKGVKKDYELYHVFCEFMAFHDIVHHSNQSDVEVKRFWDELVGDKKEIIHDPAQGWAGIGILNLMEV